MPKPDVVFPVFFAVWALLGIGSFLFFTFSKDLARKKRLYPRLAIGSGALFFVFISLMMPWPTALLVAPFLGLIAWLNIRMTRFCDSCGRMLINQIWWSKMNYCQRCGTKLPDQ